MLCHFMYVMYLHSNNMCILRFNVHTGNDVISMYVKRCGFYIDGNIIVRKDVYIKWNFDMSKEDRYLYANMIKKELGRDLDPIIDTTTSSTNYLGKKLSGYWNKIEGMNTIEAYKDLLEQYDYAKQVPGIYEYIYYMALSESSMKFINQVKTFTNMFFNPDKVITCDALACIALKLLLMQGKFEYINDVEKLCYWFYCNVGTMRIIKSEKPKDDDSYDSSYSDDKLPFDDDDEELPFT